MTAPPSDEPDDVHLVLDTDAGEAIAVRGRLDETDGAHIVYRLDVSRLSLNEPAARPSKDREGR